MLAETTTVLCSSGLDAPQKKLLTRVAADLGARVLPDFTIECTHLVSDTVLTEKYRMAIKRRMPVVSLLWLEASRDAGTFVPEEDYLLKALHNLVITLSGASFDSRSRQLIKELVNCAGGTYQAVLCSKTTHLVADCAHGSKYESVLNNKRFLHVRTVSPAWLAASLAQHTCVDSKEYPLMPAAPIADQM